jgi:hypothetical protein
LPGVVLGVGVEVPRHRAGFAADPLGLGDGVGLGWVGAPLSGPVPEVLDRFLTEFHVEVLEVVADDEPPAGVADGDDGLAAVLTPVPEVVALVAGLVDGDVMRRELVHTPRWTGGICV